MVPTAPVILNAIFHATGRRIRYLPANLKRVLLGHVLRKEGSDLACKFSLHAIRIGIPLPGFGHEKVPYSKTNGSTAAKYHEYLNKQIHGQPSW